MSAFADITDKQTNQRRAETELLAEVIKTLTAAVISLMVKQGLYLQSVNTNHVTVLPYVQLNRLVCWCYEAEPELVSAVRRSRVPSQRGEAMRETLVYVMSCSVCLTATFSITPEHFETNWHTIKLGGMTLLQRNALKKCLGHSLTKSSEEMLFFLSMNRKFDVLVLNLTSPPGAEGEQYVHNSVLK